MKILREYKVNEKIKLPHTGDTKYSMELFLKIPIKIFDNYLKIDILG